MTRILFSLMLLGIGVWLYRTFAVGRRAPMTIAEQRRAAFGAMVPSYRRTQEGKRWTLRIARRDMRKRA